MEKKSKTLTNGSLVRGNSILKGADGVVDGSDRSGHLALLDLDWSSKGCKTDTENSKDSGIEELHSEFVGRILFNNEMNVL